MKNNAVFAVTISLAIFGCASPTSMSNVERLEAIQNSKNQNTVLFHECIQRAQAEAQDRIGWNPISNILSIRRQHKENEECEKKYLH